MFRYSDDRLGLKALEMQETEAVVPSSQTAAAQERSGQFWSREMGPYKWQGVCFNVTISEVTSMVSGTPVVRFELGSIAMARLIFLSWAIWG